MPQQGNDDHVWPPRINNEPPDIDQNTRIIGLLGTRMSYPENFYTQPTPAPDDEGWFLSDFCLFWWLC